MGMGIVTPLLINSASPIPKSRQFPAIGFRMQSVVSIRACSARNKCENLSIESAPV